MAHGHEQVGRALSARDLRGTGSVRGPRGVSRPARRLERLAGRFHRRSPHRKRHPGEGPTRHRAVPEPSGFAPSALASHIGARGGWPSRGRPTLTASRRMVRRSTPIRPRRLSGSFHTRRTLFRGGTITGQGQPGRRRDRLVRCGGAQRGAPPSAAGSGDRTDAGDRGGVVPRGTARSAGSRGRARSPRRSAPRSLRQHAPMPGAGVPAMRHAPTAHARGLRRVWRYAPWQAHRGLVSLISKHFRHGASIPRNSPP
jgi:hypothetical protein